MVEKKRFIVKIDYQHCKGCELCVQFCPQKILKLTDKVNNLGYKFCTVVDEEKCNGCGVCYIMCPEYIIEIYKNK